MRKSKLHLHNVLVLFAKVCFKHNVIKRVGSIIIYSVINYLLKHNIPSWNLLFIHRKQFRSEYYHIRLEIVSISCYTIFHLMSYTQKYLGAKTVYTTNT